MKEEIEELVRERLSSIEERLAAIEHERWSHWQSYMHAQCEPQPDGALLIPAELVARWNAQISRPYEELTAEEKRSDREQVQRYLPIIVEALKG